MAPVIILFAENELPYILPANSHDHNNRYQEYCQQEIQVVLFTILHDQQPGLFRI